MSPLFRLVALGHLRVADLADVAEEMRRHRVGIAPGRHLLDDDVGQLEVEPAGDDGRHLRQRGVLDNRDRPVRRLALVAIDDGPHAGFVEANDRGEQRGWWSRFLVCSRTIEML